jgi:hypothetical protein
MPGFFGQVCKRVVFCGVVCALVATVPVRAQDAMTAAPQNRSADASTGPGPLMPSHAETFAAFVQEIGLDDLAARKEAMGEMQSRVDWDAMNHGLIGLTDDQWKTAYSILLEGSQQVANWGDEMQEALGWRDGQFQADRSTRVSEQRARFDALSDRGDSITEETMARLRQSLGNDAFGKLDAFVYQRESGGSVVDRGRIRRGPIQTAKISAMATQK